MRVLCHAVHALPAELHDTAAPLDVSLGSSLCVAGCSGITPYLNPLSSIQGSCLFSNVQVVSFVLNPFAAWSAWWSTTAWSRRRPLS